MKKGLSLKIAALLSVFAISGAFALDFGGTFNNSTKFSTNDFDPMSFDQMNWLTGWLRLPLSSDGSLYFATEGKLQFDFDAEDMSKMSDDEPSFVFDLELLKIAKVLNINGNVLQIAGGRFFVSDTTGNILAQNNDGLQAMFAADRFTAGVYAGFTGLLNAHSVSIVQASNNYNDENLYAFASPFFVFGASASLPYLFLNQTVGFEFYGMTGLKNDMNGKDYENDNEKDNRFYITATLNGPIIKNLFYTFTTTLGIFKTADSDDTDIGNMTQGTVSYYFPDFNSASVSFNALYASGEQGSFKAFKGFSEMSASYALTAHQYSSIVKAGVSASMKPLSVLYVGTGFDVVFDCLEKFEYSGFQFAGNAKWQVFSDLQLGAALSAFIGKEKENSKYEISLNGTISF